MPEHTEYQRRDWTWTVIYSSFGFTLTAMIALLAHGASERAAIKTEMIRLNSEVREEQAVTNARQDQMKDMLRDKLDAMGDKVNGIYRLLLENAIQRPKQMTKMSKEIL